MRLCVCKECTVICKEGSAINTVELLEIVTLYERMTSTAYAIILML